ncbi:MAG: transporter [Nitrococcus sp.]|nr:transporter [Nitrococcus sp.]
MQLAQADSGQQPSTGQPVGQAPPKEEQQRPQVQGMPQLGGVLTPRGVLVVTPSIRASTSQVNRFNFNGVAILDTLLIGLVEAEDTDRDLVEAALSFRLGLTNRFEVGLKLPYIYRHERTTLTLDSGNTPTQTQTFENAGLGDVEAYLHYQINRGLNGWPFFVANLRYKSTTGTGPFDVSRSAQGFPTELATGSGFQGIEPSVTILLPSDPAVFYANVGYLFNLQDDVNQTIGAGDQAQRIGEVDPGDAFRMSFGMAYAMNQYSSFNLGYQNDYIFSTSTQINGDKFESNRLIVGSAIIGFNYALSPRSQVNVSVQMGVTADAPDVVLTVQLPFAFGL